MSRFEKYYLPLSEPFARKEATTMSLELDDSTCQLLIPLGL